SVAQENMSRQMAQTWSPLAMALTGPASSLSPLASILGPAAGVGIGTAAMLSELGPLAGAAVPLGVAAGGMTAVAGAFSRGSYIADNPAQTGLQLIQSGNAAQKSGSWFNKLTDSLGGAFGTYLPALL